MGRSRKNESIMTAKNPFSNKWFSMLRNLIYAKIDPFEDEKELRKYCRICEYLSEKDEVGDAMTVESMISSVKHLGIMNHDGIGYFASYSDFTKTPCLDIENIEYLKAHEETDFIIWYNK